MRQTASFIFSMLFVAGALTTVRAAQADGSIAGAGERIITSDYRLDMFQGPVLAPARITELAGAYTAIAEGVDGIAANPAAPAVRVPWSIGWWDWDLTFGFTTSSSLGKTDFDNNGAIAFDDGTGRSEETGSDKFLFGTGGLQLQLGAWGLGLLFNVQSYHLGQEIAQPDSQPNLNVDTASGHLVLARSFLDGSVSIGAGLRSVSLDITATENEDGSGAEDKLVSMIDLAGEFGLLVAPKGQRWRVAAAYRSPVFGKPEKKEEGDVYVGGRYVPHEIVLPWEVEIGAALGLGARPFNMGWMSAKDKRDSELRELRRKQSRTQPGSKKREQLDAREERIRSLDDDQWDDVLVKRVQNLPRERYVLTASLLISGPAKDAVGLESFLTQRVQRSGQRTVFTPRVGIEMEPIRNWLQVRAGSYLEPSRFEPKLARPHLTAGLSAKLFPWTFFGLLADGTYWLAGGFFDVSRDYLSTGMTVGIWH